MTVDKQELEDLQIYIQKQIRKLSSRAIPDNSSIFDLQTIDSNISFILSSADMQHVTIIELGTKDKIVRDYLIQYRRELYSKDSEDQFTSEVAFKANEASRIISEGIMLLEQSDNPILCKNILKTFNLAKEALECIENLNENTKKYNKWSKDIIEDEDIIKPTRRTSKTTTQKKITKSSETVKKTATKKK